MICELFFLQTSEKAYFHLAAWTTSAVQTTAALDTNSIGGGPVVGSAWRELPVVLVSFI